MRKTIIGLILLAASVIVIVLSLVTHGKTTTATQDVLIGVGDSYAAGYQPLDPSGAATLHGFVDRLAPLLDETQPPSVLNFGCSGATTKTVLGTRGCTTGAQANNAPVYRTTQLDAAIAAVNAHRGHISAIVVALGANDFARCANDPNLDACISTQAPVIEGRLRQIVMQLRQTAGSSTPIIGITYPNIGLAAWLNQPPRRADAVHAQELIATHINPAILSAYRGLALVANVTAASGGLDPLPVSTEGERPASVTKVCEITWMCRQGDLHLTPAGQDFVARLISLRIKDGRG